MGKRQALLPVQYAVLVAVCDATEQLKQKGPGTMEAKVGKIRTCKASYREEIKEIILNSSIKLSDQKITELLNRRGFGLARRTIAKYRAMLLIPNSRKR